MDWWFNQGFIRNFEIKTPSLPRPKCPWAFCQNNLKNQARILVRYSDLVEKERFIALHTSVFSPRIPKISLVNTHEPDIDFKSMHFWARLSMPSNPWHENNADLCKNAFLTQLKSLHCWQKDNIEIQIYINCEKLKMSPHVLNKIYNEIPYIFFNTIYYVKKICFGNFYLFWNLSNYIMK